MATRLHLYFKCLWILVLISTLGFASSVVTDELEEEQGASFPKPLTSANFKETISSNLHLVEFYSPYCAHCRRFEPIWKKTWEEFHETGEKLGIYMSQVNCIQSGDLCNEESITAYPELRLYGPSGFLAPYTNARTTEDLIKFMREEAKNEEQAKKEETSEKKTEVKPLQYEDGDLIRYVEGAGGDPMLLVLWPFLRDADLKDQKFIQNCDECLTFHRAWKTISSALSTDIVVAQATCGQNKDICLKLGLEELTEISKQRSNREPTLAVILPRKKNNAIFYKGNKYSASDVIDFAKKVVNNYNMPKITKDEIAEIIAKPIELNKFKYPGNEETYIIFNYDSESSLIKSASLVQDIIQPLSNYRNMVVFKSDDDLVSLIKENYFKMINQVNVPGHSEYLTAITSTPYPKVFMFKEGSLVPIVYHGYVPKDMDPMKTFMEWVDQNSLQLVSEISSRNFKDLMYYHNEFYEKLVIQVIDTGDDHSKKSAENYLNNLILTAYNYEAVRYRNIYSNIVQKNLVNEGKQGSANAYSDVMQSMIENGIYKDDHKILYAYIDISRHDSLLNKLGFKVQGRDLQNGDVLIVDKKTGRYYYEHDIAGEYLTSRAPNALKDTLVALVFPHEHPGVQIKSNLINSPFGRSLRFLDSYEKWFVLFSVVLSLLTVRKIYRNYRVHKKYAAKRDVVGILGKGKKLKE
ncbi:HDL009Wp [Eremothecium sinecaudum]|uniref:HDL009Wp n=1 Tax=Eremothecium sinecaudum TaxID=45286 RepID=A0A0X8HSP7_9SACH|nr:HDL009Wp [Eremothecium sinecaudum]AMD20735.1 HDL009Wp [Eremothecium sinecaudum]